MPRSSRGTRPPVRARSSTTLVVLVCATCAALLSAGCAARHAPATGGPLYASPPLLAPAPTAGGPPAAKFEGDFGERIARFGPDRRVVALVDLTDQVDLDALARTLPGFHGGRESRRNAVIGALERVADRQQARLRPLLDRLKANGAVTYVRPVAIVNRLLVEATAAGLRALAESPEVAEVRPDWSSERRPSGAAVGVAENPEPLPEHFRSWAVDAVGAPRLWAAGLDGSGVVVGIIDTGAYEAHEQLRGRALPGDRGWYDPVEGTTSPSDHHGHGTGVLSQAVGGNPSGRVMGIAPGARWCAALGNWKNFYRRSRMTLAADWMLRVGRPDVLVNAWSHDEGICSDFDRPFIDAWKASGIFVVFPAGNAGPAPATGESPAQLAGIFPDGGPVFSVAGLAEDGRPLPISSRGPSRCGSPAFPTVAGPGGPLPMALPGGPRYYTRGEGTSLTAGIVGGAAALLLEAEPEAGPDAIARALSAGARDLAPPGRDDVTGAGAIDLPAALAALRRERAR